MKERTMPKAIDSVTEKRAVGVAAESDADGRALVQKWAVFFGLDLIRMVPAPSVGIAIIQAGQASTLVVPDVSSVETQALEDFASGRYRLIAANQGLDSASAAGRLYVVVSKTLPVAHNPAAFVTDPVWAPRGRVPYGKRVVNGEVVPHPVEQELIQQARLMRDKGMNDNAIAREVSKMGFRTRVNTRLHAVQIGRILRGDDEGV